ncbi:hypothetical protein HDU97_004790 [Phlyctochytrium planicorne]|nr:hypothetical protein HDU97_004790 [Phlyctochytrium planicorne]
MVETGLIKSFSRTESVMKGLSDMIKAEELSCTLNSNDGSWKSEEKAENEAGKKEESKPVYATPSPSLELKRESNKTAPVPLNSDIDGAQKQDEKTTPRKCNRSKPPRPPLPTIPHHQYIVDPFDIFSRTEEEQERHWRSDPGPPVSCVCAKCREKLYRQASLAPIKYCIISALLIIAITMLSAPYPFYFHQEKTNRMVNLEDRMIALEDSHIITWSFVYWVSAPLLHWVSTINQSLLGLMCSRMTRIKHLVFLQRFSEDVKRAVSVLEKAERIEDVIKLKSGDGEDHFGRHMRERKEIIEDFSTFFAVYRFYASKFRICDFFYNDGSNQSFIKLSSHSL